MARLVVGIGVSHTPQMSMPSELWASYAQNDSKNPNLWFRGRHWAFEELVAERSGEGLEKVVTESVFADLHARAQDAVEELSRTLTAASVDVAVVIGDDHHELFTEDSMPTFAVYWGESIESIPPTSYYFPEVAAAAWALYGEQKELYPCHAELGKHLITELNELGFDVAQVRRPPPETSVGHPFTLVRNRLMDRSVAPLPIVPVLVNTYFPPNTPTPARCWQLGKALRAAIESASDDLRVAVIASGGLSHFVVDEDLDRRLLEAMRQGDDEGINTLPRGEFVSGTSESLCWLVAGGASAGLAMEVVDYLPGYRTLAGTGCGMAMVRWQ